MKIHELDVVELKDGRQGTVLEIFGSGDNEEYYIETVGEEMDFWPTVGADKIRKIIWKHRQ